jgi:GR25 family glycosyltransferase involved in LPS biosynthesis
MKKYDIQIINLDKNIARWANMDSQFRKQGISNVKRFSAIDGKTIESSPKISLVHPKALESAKRGFRLSHEEHNFGSIGCYLSHAGAWQNIADSSNDFGIIFEDDIKLPAEFISKFEKMIKDAPSDWEVLVFGPYELVDPIRQRKKQNSSMHSFVISRWFMLNSYAIKSSCCKKFLKRAFPVKIQVDWWVSAQQGDCKIWILEKPITEFSQGFRSDINHTPVVKADRGSLVNYEIASGKTMGMTSSQQNSLTIIIITIVFVIAVAVATTTSVLLVAKKKRELRKNKIESY